jgi:hypothetical protein
MPKRTLVMVVALLLLAAAGALVYINSTPKTAALAEDCEDKPKPANEFALAAECDTPGAPVAAPAPAPASQGAAGAR